jgi:hypothetical protein
MWCLLGKPGRHLVGPAAEVEDRLAADRPRPGDRDAADLIGPWNEFLWPFLTSAPTSRKAAHAATLWAMFQLTRRTIANTVSGFGSTRLPGDASL